MSVSLDLTGTKFGMLTAIRRAENVNGKAAWLCRCECGSELIVLTKYLRSGKRTNCGCQKHGVESLHYVDGTCIEMLQSNTLRSNNRSGTTGVFYDKASEKWRAEIMLQGKRHYLGRFPSYEAAVKARSTAKEKLHDAFVASYIKEHYECKSRP